MWKIKTVINSEECLCSDLGKDYKYLVCKKEQYGGEDSVTPCIKDNCPNKTDDAEVN